MAATFAAVLVVLPAGAGAERIARPRFYPYYYPYCPHDYWHFLEGSAPPSWCGPRPEVVAVEPIPEPEPARLGLGVFGGSVAVERDESGVDLGVIGRLRLWRHLQLEAELSRTEIEDGDRVDKRVGGALLVPLLPHAALSPYLLGGGGLSRVERNGGSLTADQVYGELGVGLEWSLARHFSLFGDLRAGVRRSDARDDDRVLVRRGGGGPAVDEDERTARARIGALMYF